MRKNHKKRKGDSLYKINLLKKGVYLVNFDELLTTEYQTTTNILLVENKNKIFVCDTYLGASYLEQVLREIWSDFQSREYVVFNSHAHWDHYWGNSFFAKHQIVADYLCYQEMQQSFWADYRKNQYLAAELVELCLPNLLFTGKINFPEAEVEVFHTPGHSEDGISVFFQKQGILFAGDNLEYLIPTYCDFSQGTTQYQATLKQYLDLKAEIYVPGHEGVLSSVEVERNLQYLVDVENGNIKKYFDNKYIHKHKTNYI